VGFHMGYKFLSSLGLRLTGRTFVTKRNCTPDPQIGCCGKPFIFNSGHLQRYLLSCLSKRSSSFGFGEVSGYFYLLSCNDSRKFLPDRTLPQLCGVILPETKIYRR
jgi:hypothetical protein